MELSYGKLLAAISLSLVTFISSMLPLLLIKRFETDGRSRNFRVVSFLSCFGGGVFMATCLLHLFPDVKYQMVLIFKTMNVECNYPIAEFLLCFGFLTVLIVEQIVLSCQEYSIPKEKVNIINQQHSHIEPYQNYGAVSQDTEPESHQHSHIEPYQNYTAASQNSELDSHDVPFSVNGFEQNEDFEPHTHEVSFHQDMSSHSVLRSLLLIFALALHSIFEGLAIGLQSSATSVIKILVAVIIHKCIIAFTLGLNLTHSKLKKSNIIKGNIFFSLTSPIGIIIGLVVVDFVTGLPMLVTSSVLQGLAAGTFLYVTFFEVLPHELNSSEDRMIKMGCLVLGFSVISILLLFLPT